MLQFRFWRKGKVVTSGPKALADRTHLPGGEVKQGVLLPKLYVDVSIISQHDAGTGIQRVVRALSEQLGRFSGENYTVVFVRASKARKYHQIADRFSLHTGEVADCNEASAIYPEKGDVFLGLDLSSRILPRQSRQIVRWRRTGVHIAMVVYDLLPIINPEWFEKKQVRAFRKWLRFLGKYCDSAICISQHVKDSLEGWLLANDCSRRDMIQCSVIPLGGDIPSSERSSGISDEDRSALTILGRMPYVMVVGTIEPRKGHIFVLDAFDHIFQEAPTDSLALVIVGRAGWKTSSLQDRMRSHPRRAKQLFWFDTASDELLDWLYKGCSGVILPTLAEGFGLPLAEAVTHQRPVLARDLPVFRENEWPGISYFSDDSPIELAKKIVEWLDVGKQHQIAVNQDRLTWQNSCEKMLGHLKFA